MADDTKQAENAEEQAQQPAVPTGEQKGQEETDSQEVAGESQETLETPAGESEGELPKEVSERTTQQFEKLKAQLREAREKLFRQGSQEQVGGEMKPLYDPTTGLVDVEALTDLQKRTFAAEKKVAQVEQNIQLKAQETQVNELYSAHPELKNPKAKDAIELFNESERIWLHSQAYPEKYGGEALSQKQAADLAKKKMGNKPETPIEEAQRLEPKEQASLGASGQPTQGVKSKISSEEELNRQRLGTRLGDKDSMISRMRAIRETSEAEQK